MSEGSVVGVSLSARHTFSKLPQMRIELLAGLGVRGDAHCGATVRHRYLVRRDPTRPNLTQVHLLQAEIFDELRSLGFDLVPGELGENITTSDLDLLRLPLGTLLGIGSDAVVELTGLRTPCIQMNRLRPGLMAALDRRDAEGRRAPIAGVMGIVRKGGEVEPGARVRVELPPGPHRMLPCV